MKQVVFLLLALAVGIPLANGQTQPEPKNQKSDILQLDMGILMVRLYPDKAAEKVPKGSLLPATWPDLNEALAEDYTRINARGQVITKQAELERSRQRVTTLCEYRKFHLRHYYLGNGQAH